MLTFGNEAREQAQYQFRGLPGWLVLDRVGKPTGKHAILNTNSYRPVAVKNNLTILMISLCPGHSREPWTPRAP